MLLPVKWNVYILKLKFSKASDLSFTYVGVTPFISSLIRYSMLLRISNSVHLIEILSA